MNANFGIIAPLEQKVRGGKQARYEVVANRSLEQIDAIKAIIE
jgi:folate-dependent tRNA-U54 methylase TrmFO/GidA